MTQRAPAEIRTPDVDRRNRPSETRSAVRRAPSVRAVAAAALLAILAGCSSSEPVTVAEEPPETIFERGERALATGDAAEAAKQFDEVERLYPTSTWAKRAIIQAANAYYIDAEYDQAILTAQRFLDFYPSDDEAPFAQYIVAMSHYDQIVDVGRDQARTRAAQQALRELINRYPNSDYANEAQLKLDATFDHLAGKEMEVGRYYLKRGNFIAAISRFQNVVASYQTTRHVEEALHRLVEANLALGLTREAQATAAVLGHNFPGSAWYADSYLLLTGVDLRPEAADDSWISRTWNSVTEIQLF